MSIGGARCYGRVSCFSFQRKHRCGRALHWREIRVCKSVQYICHHPKGKNCAKDAENWRKSGKPALWFFLWYLSFFELLHRVEEQNYPCFVSFHLSHWTEENFALAVGQGLKRDIFSKYQFLCITSRCLSILYSAVSSAELREWGETVKWRGRAKDVLPQLLL